MTTNQHEMNAKFLKEIQEATSVTIIQPDNPDGDSVGAALALEEILEDKGVKVSLYCAVGVPEYLRYIEGWDRITDEFEESKQYIIVDTSSEALLEKLLASNTSRAALISASSPIWVLDHHETASDLTFEHEIVGDPRASSTGESIYTLLSNQEGSELSINDRAAQKLLAAMMADTLGLTTPAVTAEVIATVAELVRLGASIHQLEEARRELMKKTKEISRYKGELLQRVQYALEDRLAYAHITWDDIENYSHSYNPGALLIEELRMVQGVALAVAIKTYPDGKITGKLRAMSGHPIAEQVAGHFGGGGHAYAAGFKVFDYNYDELVSELISATNQALQGEHNE